VTETGDISVNLAHLLDHSPGLGLFSQRRTEQYSYTICTYFAIKPTAL